MASDRPVSAQRGPSHKVVFTVARLEAADAIILR
jgi:hypothetical protein